MSYTIYNLKTTRILYGNDGKERWLTETAAKTARTKILNKHPEFGVVGDFAIVPSTVFYSSIEKKKIVKSLMSGQDVEISVNTPLCSDPSSETYWSM